MTKKINLMTGVVLAAFAASPSYSAENRSHFAQATECRQLECSGRHIDCGGKNPIAKLDCERKKSAWKAQCELKKEACKKIEGI